MGRISLKPVYFSVSSFWESGSHYQTTGSTVSQTRPAARPYRDSWAGGTFQDTSAENIFLNSADVANHITSDDGLWNNHYMKILFWHHTVISLLFVLSGLVSSVTACAAWPHHIYNLWPLTAEVWPGRNEVADILPSPQDIPLYSAHSHILQHWHGHNDRVLNPLKYYGPWLIKNPQEWEIISANERVQIK